MTIFSNFFSFETLKLTLAQLMGTRKVNYREMQQLDSVSKPKRGTCGVKISDLKLFAKMFYLS